MMECLRKAPVPQRLPTSAEIRCMLDRALHPGQEIAVGRVERLTVCIQHCTTNEATQLVVPVLPTSKMSL
jgi:hypothetical protein